MPNVESERYATKHMSGLLLPSILRTGEIEEVSRVSEKEIQAVPVV